MKEKNSVFLRSSFIVSTNFFFSNRKSCFLNNLISFFCGLLKLLSFYFCISTIQSLSILYLVCTIYLLLFLPFFARIFLFLGLRTAKPRFSTNSVNCTLVKRIFLNIFTLFSYYKNILDNLVMMQKWQIFRKQTKVYVRCFSSFLVQHSSNEHIYINQHITKS